MQTHSHLAYQAAGSPPVAQGQIQVSGPCTTCGAITPTGVALSEIETPTTSGHADLFRFGTRHVCPACAWLFGAGKGRPGNFFVAGQRIEYTVISLDSVVKEKLPWLTVLHSAVSLPKDTPTTGVMTTDVKPRLWHRARLSSIGNFGLYLHCPEYDVSEWRMFDLHACVGLIDKMVPMLSAGFSKSSLYFCLLRDHKRAGNNLHQVMAWEKMLTQQRQMPHFLPALIAAGISKQSKD